MAIVTSRLDASGNLLAFSDSQTDETIQMMAGCQFIDDFSGALAAYPVPGSAVLGCPWVAKIQQTAGAPSVARVAGAVGGIVSLALDGTPEKQEATLYFGDELEFDVNGVAAFEAVAAAEVVPSAAGVELVLGLMSTWVDGPDNNAFFARFKCSGNGAVLCETFDGATLSSNPSGVTLIAGQFHTFRVDATYAPATTPGVRFWIDGNLLALGAPNVFNVAAPSSQLQPYLGVYKPNGAGAATLYVDKVSAWQFRPMSYL